MVAGVVTTPLPTVSCIPEGCVVKVTSIVLGSTRTDLVSVKPRLSVTVSANVRYAGYSCSGATNDPPAPTNVPWGCSWH